MKVFLTNHARKRITERIKPLLKDGTNPDKKIIDDVCNAFVLCSTTRKPPKWVSQSRKFEKSARMRFVKSMAGDTPFVSVVSTKDSKFARVVTVISKSG
jgi:hypothetical protein